ncbi:MAG: T9SS type A sorting domain-containing protein, partial [Ignavibacteriales bacterium]|nr:T9SS type A sorting domain-containing protein [Ignavibacteriales bacterium]
VRAKNLVGYSDFSAARSFTTEALAAPSAPALASPTSGAVNQSLSLTLRWSSSVTAASYRIQVTTDPTTGGGGEFTTNIFQDATISDTSTALSGLANSTTYYWHVSATNSGGTSPYSSTFSFSTRAASAPTVTTNAATGVTLNTAIVHATVNPNGDTATVVFFQWGENVDFDRTTENKLPKIKVSGVNPVNVSDTLKNLIAGRTYTYRAVARNSNSQTSLGGDQTVTPATLPLAPTSLQVTTFNASSATIAWADNSTNEESFRLDRKFGSGAWVENFRILPSVPPGTTTYQDTGLTANSTYYYRVRAYNSAGYSAYTDSIMVETVLAPFAQSSVRAVTFPDQEIPNATTDTTIVLTNTGSADLNVNIPSTLSGTHASQFAVVSGSSPFTVKLTPGQNRNIVVRFQPNSLGAKQAVLLLQTDDFGHYPPDGVLADTLKGNGVDTTPPGVPVSLGPDPSQIGWHRGVTYTINWQGPSDASGVVKLWYKYDSAPTLGDAGNFVTALTSGAAGTAQITPPTAGTHLTYFYLEDAAGNKEVNNTSTVTLRYDNVAPTITHDSATVAAVVILNGAVQGSGAVIQASASKASELSGVNPTTFKLQWKKTSDGTWGSELAFPSIASSQTIPASAFITNNQPNSLEYRITATDTAGNVSTTDAYPVKVDIQTGAPTGLSSPAATNWTNSNTITVLWTGPPNAFNISKLWYKYDSPPTSGQEGFFVNVGGTTGNWSASILSPSSPGQHLVYFYVEDALGNKTIGNYASLTILYDNVPPTISHDSASVGPVTITAGVATSPKSITASSTKLSSLSPIASMSLEYRRVEVSTWTPVSYNAPFTNSAAAIPADVFTSGGVPNNIVYRITATDSAQNIKTTNAWSIVTVISDQPPPQPTPLPAASTMPGTEVKAYRLFSVPYQLTDQKPSSYIPASLGPHADGDVNYVNWRMQRITGGGTSTPDDYETFKDESALKPGAAFFLVVREADKKVTVSGATTVNAQVMNNDGIQLTQGWNLVGNPFTTAISYDSLRSSGPGAITDWAYYDGQGPRGSGWWTDANHKSLLPWEGLALYATQATKLLFGVIGQQTGVAPSFNLEAPLSVASKNSENESAWIVNVNAYRTDNDLKDEGNGVGMTDGASTGHDSYDSYQPPILEGKNVAVYFKGETSGRDMDIRPINDQGDSWDMKVITGDKGARIRLDLSGAKAIPNPAFEAYLVDLDESMAYNLRTTSAVEVNSKQGVRNFVVLVGTREFVDRERRGVDLVPREMKLFANYPNPFNPETVIRYQVSGAREVYNVSLKVYNLLGQEVVTLVEQEQIPGYYEIKFSARSLTTGVYFYRITVDGGTQDSRYVDVKKMMLMK